VAQQFVHHDASQPTTTHPAPATLPAGPNATAHPAYGLCNAWAHAKAHGIGKRKAVAFHHLAEAAGGVGNIAAYCAAVPHPGASSLPATHPTGHPGSWPPAHRTGPPATPPAGPPASHPVGPPTTHP
jgi:hypothetical protein